MTPTGTWPKDIRRVVILAFRVPEASGGAVVVESYVRMFKAAGLEVEVLSMYPGTRAASFTPTVVLRRESLQRWPVIGDRHGWRKAVRLPLVVLKRLDRVLALRRLRRRLEALDARTLLVITDVLPYSLVREAGVTWRRDRPLLVGQHHTTFDSFEFAPDFKTRVANEFADVDAFTALSATDAVRYQALIGVPCFAVPNPVSLTECGPPRDEPPHGSLAVALARYSPEKQLDLMIRSFATATREGPLAHWELELYGWGPDEQRLRRLIAELGESDRIRVVGPVDDVRPVLRRAACHLLTSRYEGFGLSVLEASQCGVPTVAFASSPGLSELLESVDGVRVEPEAGEAGFARVLREVLTAPEELAERGRHAREGATTYSIEAVLGVWAHVVRAAMSERHRRSRRLGE